MIASISGVCDMVSVSKTQASTSSVIDSLKNESASSVLSSNTSHISTLSRQLSESAVRAEARDRSMTRRELGVEAARLDSQILGDAYQARKQDYNKELPQTADPELLERARLATEYIVRSDAHDRTVKNPFTGLSREQLNLIAYDEQGPYTINERRAAWYGVSDIESEWNHKVMRLYDMEAAAYITNTPKTNTEIIAHYRTLPAIEQAQYPDNYESRLQAEIDYKGAPAKKDIKIYTLFEVLARMKLSGRTAKDSDANPSGLAPTNSTSNTASAITTSN